MADILVFNGREKKRADCVIGQLSFIIMGIS